MTGNSPNSPSPQDRYDVVTIAFHWITAVLVLVLFGSALVWNSTPRDWDLDWLEDLHVSLGIALAVVLVGRLAWRVFASRRLPGAGAPVIQLAPKLVHGILYVLLALQVVLGVGLRWVQGQDFSFFGLFSLPVAAEANRELSRQVSGLHDVTAWALMYLVIAHAGAALFHRYVLKDGVLKRMMPTGS